jgi:hypothetical protein
MNKHERLLKALLRAVGCVSCLAVVPVFMPRGWMDIGHRMLGLGPLPEGPIVEYLARSVSAFYAMFGVLLLLSATDVRRYTGLITVLAVFAVLFGAVITIYDHLLGLPWYWTAAEGPVLVAFGVILVELQRRVARPRGSPASPTGGPTSE